MFYFLILILATCKLFTATESTLNSLNNGQELLLCRKCGGDVADSNYLFTKQSPGARDIKKQNLFGQQNVTVQTLVNPFGVQFDILTLEKTKCHNLGLPQGADSWFPGYTWRICTCPYCGQHLGWTFEQSIKSEDEHRHIDSFHGLILDKILGENFTDSLIMMYKM